MGVSSQMIGDENTSDNPFSQITNLFIKILKIAISTTIFFGTAIILLSIYEGIDPGKGQNFAITETRKSIDRILDFVGDAWMTISPIFQLSAVLFIVWWFFKKSGISISNIGSSNETQKILAITVISSLCLAAFVNREAASILKDIALVVVGFYFGSKQTDNNSTTTNSETDKL